MGETELHCFIIKLTDYSICVFKNISYFSINKHLFTRLVLGNILSFNKISFDPIYVLMNRLIYSFGYSKLQQSSKFEATGRDLVYVRYI